MVKDMAKRNALGVATDLAHHIKALVDIIKALMQGGWAAAALQVLKHYWPQILAISLILTFLPAIIYCCLPMVMFGYESAENAEIAAMTEQADQVAGWYAQYPIYLEEAVTHIRTTITESKPETDDETHEEEKAEGDSYEVVVSGIPLSQNWFIALHAVYIGNNLNEATEQNVRDFAGKCVTFTVTDYNQDAENDVVNEATSTTKQLTIQYCTPDEIMDAYSYSTADRNWAQLMYSTLQGDEVTNA